MDERPPTAANVPRRPEILWGLVARTGEGPCWINQGDVRDAVRADHAPRAFGSLGAAWAAAELFPVDCEPAVLAVGPPPPMTRGVHMACQPGQGVLLRDFVRPAITDPIGSDGLAWAVTCSPRGHVVGNQYEVAWTTRPDGTKDVHRCPVGV